MEILQHILSDSVVLTISIIMLLFVVIDLISNWRERHWDLRPAVVSLGLLGTFLGIAIALYYFDPVKIKESIPKLLNGLKIAFSTSIMGIFLSIFLLVVNNFKARRNPKSSEELLVEFMEQAGNQNKNFVESVSKIEKQLNVLDDSLKKGFEKMGKSLSEALDNISKGASEQIIDALNHTIHNFNENLVEQFGENFKQLNDACKELVLWQEQHKESVEQTHRQLGATVQALDKTSQTLESISNRNEEALQTYNNLREIIQTFDSQAQALTNHLQQYANLASKADAMFSGAKQRFEEIADELGKCKVELAKNLENTMGDIKVYNKKNQEMINSQSQVVKDLLAELKHALGQLEQVFIDINEKLGENYAKYIQAAAEAAKKPGD